MAVLSLICSDLTRLPTVLTGIALRAETFTVTKMSTLRWLIDIPAISHTSLVDLLDGMPRCVDIHSHTP